MSFDSAFHDTAPPGGDEYRGKARHDETLSPFAASGLAGLPVPPRKWLVESFIPRHTVTLLNGDGGTGKSLLALQLAYEVARGGQWLRNHVEQGTVLFLTAEDDWEELHRRLDYIAGEVRDLDEQDRLKILSLAGHDALLGATVPGSSIISPTALFKRLDRWIEENVPILVVLDTLADLFGGHENDRAQARQFIGLLRGLAIRHQTTILLLAHPSLSGLASGSGTSGSTAWNNSVRSRLYLRRVLDTSGDQPYEANKNRRVLTTMKANYGPTGEEINLTWTAGVFEADKATSGLDRMSASAKAERVFLSLLRRFTEEGRNVNHAGGPNYAPKVFAEHPNAEGVTKGMLRTAMNGLLASEKIRVEKYGPPSKASTKIVEVGSND